ncbi:class I SAM-dependent methyltransferase [Nocardia tengchongensis]|uniref:class I SAM-dependent methyltransferase n=1 Tax=Nocardia tengchongensis TaxID=2055889 RepID=UPI00368E07A7
MSEAAVAGDAAPRASRDRGPRLLAAARQRYAEDRLADAVSAGTRQVIVFGRALDTFAAHNPYRDVRFIRVTDTGIGIALPTADSDRFGPATPSQVAEFARYVGGFDPEAPVFAIHLGDQYRVHPRGTPTPRRASVGVEVPAAGRCLSKGVLTLLAGCPGGAELVLDAPLTATARMARLLRETGWETMEELAADVLAARYLDAAPERDYSVEPWVVRARVAQ